MSKPTTFALSCMCASFRRANACVLILAVAILVLLMFSNSLPLVGVSTASLGLRSYSQHDLSDLLVRFQVLVRFDESVRRFQQRDNLSLRDRLINHRPFLNLV
jgi:hypothetical protein